MEERPVDLKYQINLPAPEDDLDKQLEQTVNVFPFDTVQKLILATILKDKIFSGFINTRHELLASKSLGHDL